MQNLLVEKIQFGLQFAKMMDAYGKIVVWGRIVMKPASGVAYIHAWQPYFDKMAMGFIPARRCCLHGYSPPQDYFATSIHHFRKLQAKLYLISKQILHLTPLRGPKWC